MLAIVSQVPSTALRAMTMLIVVCAVAGCKPPEKATACASDSICNGQAGTFCSADRRYVVRCEAQSPGCFHALKDWCGHSSRCQQKSGSTPVCAEPPTVPTIRCYGVLRPGRTLPEGFVPNPSFLPMEVGTLSTVIRISGRHDPDVKYSVGFEIKGRVIPARLLDTRTVRDSGTAYLLHRVRVPAEVRSAANVMLRFQAISNGPKVTVKLQGPLRSGSARSLRSRRSCKP